MVRSSGGASRVQKGFYKRAVKSSFVGCVGPGSRQHLNPETEESAQEFECHNVQAQDQNGA